MKLLKRTAGLLATAIWLASPVCAKNVGKSAVNEAAAVKALQSAMTPGEGQKKLAPMIGTFDVKIRTWVSPASQPVEFTGTMVSAWVLDGRYIQSMLAGEVGGGPFSGIGYIGYDNVEKVYQTAWMDTGSTGMVWYTGNMDASGKSAIKLQSLYNQKLITASEYQASKQKILNEMTQ
jgi:hypothetical protein